jgi:hypothetical protein
MLFQQFANHLQRDTHSSRFNCSPPINHKVTVEFFLSDFGSYLAVVEGRSYIPCGLLMAEESLKGERTMAKVNKSTDSSSLAEVVDRILDKGIVIDAWVKVSLVGIELLSVEARVVIASVETYLKYAEAIGLTASAAAPA